MKLKDMLTETPLIINDIDWHDLNDIEKNHFGYEDRCSKKFQYKKELIRLSDNAVLYQFNTQYFCLDYELKRITYFMKCEVGNNGVLGDFAWQSLVWEYAPVSNEYLNNIPTKIFWNYLFKKFGTIITDSEQKWHGKRFWELRIAEALKLNLNVYYFDFNNRQIEQLERFDDLQNFQIQYDIWGKQPKNELRIMVITNKTLPLTKKQQ